MARPQRFCLAASAVFVLTSVVFSQAYVDAQGREWRQTAASINATWNQIAAIAPTDGVTPAQGFLNGQDLTGWVWATRQQVTELYSEFVPEIAQSPSLGGSAYTLAGLYFLGVFQPTSQFYTTFGGSLYVSGWTATSNGNQAYIPEASGQYPVFYGSFNTAALADKTSATQFRGAWFFRPAAGTFQNLGGSLAGTSGYAGLVGTGTLLPGAPTNFAIQRGPVSGLAYLIVGFSAVNVPIFGGTLIPNLDIIVPDLPLDPQGAYTLTAPWPAGLVQGTEIFFQAWFVDAGAPQGFAATNAIKIVAP